MIFVLTARGHEIDAAVVARVDRQIDEEDLHFEHVARFRSFDIHRAGQEIADVIIVLYLH